jgi:predicted acetyltransferase
LWAYKTCARAILSEAQNIYKKNTLEINSQQIKYWKIKFKKNNIQGSKRKKKLLKGKKKARTT